MIPILGLFNTVNLLLTFQTKMYDMGMSRNWKGFSENERYYMKCNIKPFLTLSKNSGVTLWLMFSTSCGWCCQAGFNDFWLIFDLLDPYKSTF